MPVSCMEFCASREALAPRDVGARALVCVFARKNCGNHARRKSKLLRPLVSHTSRMFLLLAWHTRESFHTCARASNISPLRKRNPTNQILTPFCCLRVEFHKACTLSHTTNERRTLSAVVMFSLIVGLFEYLFRKDELHVLILGLDKAGKTNVLERLKSTFTSSTGVDPVKILPTVGLNVGRLDAFSHSFIFWDLGGQPSLRSIW